MTDNPSLRQCAFDGDVNGFDADHFGASACECCAHGCPCCGHAEVVVVGQIHHDGTFTESDWLGEQARIDDSLDNDERWQADRQEPQE